MNNLSMFEAAKHIVFKTTSNVKPELYNFIENVIKWNKVKKILIILS